MRGYLTPRASRSIIRPIVRPITGYSDGFTQWTESQLLDPAAWFRAETGPLTDTGASFASASSQYLSSSSSDFNPGNSDFTICFWFKLATVGAARYLVNKYAAAPQRALQCYFDNTNSRIRVLLSGNGTGEAAISTAVSSVAVSTWYFVAIRYDAANDLIRLRLNETDITPVSQSLGMYASTADFMVGGSPAVPGYHNGLIDSLGYWKTRHLSDADLTSIYNAGVGCRYATLPAGALTGLTAFCNFDETSGNRSDASGGGHTLSDNNGVTRGGGIAAGNVSVDADPVSLWQNQSVGGSAYDASQATGTKRGAWYDNQVNGYPVVTLDGSDDYFDWLLATDIPTVSAYFYANLDPATTQFYWIGDGTGTNGFKQNSLTNLQVINTGGTVSITHDEITAGWKLYTMIHDDGAVVRYVNGVIDGFDLGGSSGNVPVDALFSLTGASMFAKGDIAEMLFYTVAHNQSQVETIASYFSEKYEG